MSIVVFDPMAQSYEGNGEAVLVPLECRVRMAAGGEYSFSMDHPIDPWGKWTRLVREAIVRLPVPAERIENSFTGIEADIYTANADTEMRDGTTKPSTISYNAWSQYNTYSVGSKVTSQSRNYQCVYWDSNSTYRAERPGASSWWKEIARTTPGSPVLMNVPQGTKLYYVSDAGSGWYKMSTYYGLEGYIESSKLTFDHHSSQSENQPREITEQLFRIREVNIDRTGGKVSVGGVHVSYDLNGVLVEDIEIGQASPAMAIGRLTEAMLGDYPGMIATDMDDTDATFTGSFKKKNAMSCLTDPDSGIVPAFGAKFTRDNWDLFVMEDPETDRGYRIRYGKNADGIQWKIRSDGLITRVMPVAKNEDGSDLYLPELFVDSAHIGEYPVVYMESLSVKGQVGKDDGSGTDTVWTEEALLDEMRAKAEERFSVAKVDEPATEVTVQLEQLEKTDEFKYLQNLLRVNLYDVVKAEDPEIGLDISLKVTEIEFDAIREKIAGIKVSNTGGNIGRTVTGYNVVNKSIGLEKLKDEVTTGILGEAVSQAVQDAEQRMPTVKNNSKDDAGIVAAGSGNAGKVWKTDGQGNPAWRDETGGGVTVYDGLDSTSTTDALSANQGRVLNNHFAVYGSTQSPVTNLDDLPNGGLGRVILAAAISPSGVLRAHSYWKTGSGTRYTVFAVDEYTQRAYYNVMYDGTLTGWTAIPNGVIDNLTSTSTTAALSANQGRVLDGKIPTVVDGLNSQSTTAALSANQGRVLNNHFAVYGSAQSPVTNLDDLPNGGLGRVVLAAAVSPSGVLRAHAYWKTGSGTRYTIFVIDEYSRIAYYNVMYDGTLMGWIRIPTGVIDNLTSTSSTAALSANQGRILDLKASMIVTVTSLLDFNNAASGLVYVSNDVASNAPPETGGYWFILTTQDAETSHKFQLAMHSISGSIFARGWGNDTGWRTWKQL